MKFTSFLLAIQATLPGAKHVERDRMEVAEWLTLGKPHVWSMVDSGPSTQYWMDLGYGYVASFRDGVVQALIRPGHGLNGD